MSNYNIPLKILAVALAILSLASCDMLETHPYDTDISGERDINRKNIARIETNLREQQSFKFAVISDTQRWYDETKDAVKALNLRDDIDFVIHCGDQADFGLTDEFMLMRDILNKLDVPYVALIGNHDCLGTGKVSFREIYGPTNFAFTASDVKFVCLNTNALEFDYSEPIPDFNFLRSELENISDKVKRTIFVMHAAPGTDVFNNNVEGVFRYYTSIFPSLQCYIYGHTHALTVEQQEYEGVKYYCYQCPNIKKRYYLLFTVNQDGYEYEAVEF